MGDVLLIFIIIGIVSFIIYSIILGNSIKNHRKEIAKRLSSLKFDKNGVYFYSNDKGEFFDIYLDKIKKQIALFKYRPSIFESNLELKLINFSEVIRCESNRERHRTLDYSMKATTMDALLRVTTKSGYRKKIFIVKNLYAKIITKAEEIRISLLNNETREDSNSFQKAEYFLNNLNSLIEYAKTNQ